MTTRSRPSKFSSAYERMLKAKAAKEKSQPWRNKGEHVPDGIQPEAWFFLDHIDLEADVDPLGTLLDARADQSTTQMKVDVAQESTGDRLDWRRRAPSRAGLHARMEQHSRRHGSWTAGFLGPHIQQRIIQRALPTQQALQGQLPPRRRSKANATALKLHAERQPDRLRLTASSQEFASRWLDVLSHERALATAAIEQRRSWPVDKLVQRGYALEGLHAYWQGTSQKHFGHRVAVFKYPGVQSFEWNRFRPGDNVEVSSAEMRANAVEVLASAATSSGDSARSSSSQAKKKGMAPASAIEKGKGPSKALPLIGTVLEKGARHIRIFFEGDAQQADIEACNSWRLYQLDNDIADLRTDQALAALSHDVDFLEQPLESGKELILSGCGISDVVMGIERPAERNERGIFASDQRIQSWVERHCCDAPLTVEGDPKIDLNATQLKAVAMMLRERVSLVQGPPGTGKTRTLVEAIKLLKLGFEVPHPLLLTSHTNVAVDNLAEGCRDAGLKVVRIGSSARVRPGLMGITLDAHMARHPRRGRLEETKEEIARCEKELNQMEWRNKQAVAIEAPAALEEEDAEGREALRETSTLASLRLRLRTLRARRFMLSKIILGEILHGADVVVSTAISAGSPGLRMIDFPIVFFDEGSMATEPISLIPLMKGCRQLAVIGDHKQLPPVVLSPGARQNGLTLSLFERLINRGDVPSVMLDEQHRMPPQLSLFPNESFYNAALKDGEGTHQLQPLVSAFQSEAKTHLTFITHKGNESPVDKSLSNREEIALVARVAVDLLVQNPSLRGSDIGIITPYIAQVQGFQRLLKRDNTERRALEALLPSNRATELADIEAHTVDGFEGREKAAIIFSTVRTNEGGYVGFLADRRRMNVALTRAKQSLFVVGDLGTLRKAQLSEKGAQAVEQPDIPALRRYATMLEEKALVVDGTAIMHSLWPDLAKQEDHTAVGDEPVAELPFGSIGLGQSYY